MINKKEWFIIALVIIIISLSITLLAVTDLQMILGILLSVAIIVLTTIFAKKLMAYLLDSEIEMRIWEIRGGKAQKAFPIGAFLPLITGLVFFFFKGFVWMASLVFDVKPRVYRGAKRFGLYTFSEITEYHLGLIAAAGIIASLILAVVGYFLGFTFFSRLNILFAFFNMIPFSELDGNRIFFGSKVLWSVLACLVLIGMLFAIFVI